MSESDSQDTASQELESLEPKWLKLRMADAARMMMDNQGVLDGVTKQTADDRRYENRVRDAIAEQRMGVSPSGSDGAGDAQEGAGEMKINIDSPTTINYQGTPSPAEQAEQAAATEQPQKSIVAKALPYVLSALLAGSMAGGPLLGAWLSGGLSPSTDPPAAEYVDHTTSIGIGGGEPTLEW